MCRCQKQFGFENPEQMQLNSLVNHKKRMGKCQNRTLWVSKNLWPSPLVTLSPTLLPPRHVIYGWSQSFISVFAIFSVFILRSPLCDAVHNNDDQLLNFLVRRCKANVDAQFPDASGTSASLLHVAADRGHKSIIQTLQTDYKLDINQLDSL